MNLIIVALLINFLCSVSQINGYDTFDPMGKIIIKWDVIKVNEDSTQDVSVNILNYQLYRHIELPGWKLSFIWPGKQVIWNMVGAETTQRGRCSAYKGSNIPHCCERKPVVIDLLPGAPYNQQVANCCKAGVLSSITQAPDKSGAAFQMTISTDSSSNSKTSNIPLNFSLGVPGYTCVKAVEVPPSKFSEDHGRRQTQALATYNVTCSYSQFRPSHSPICCVSLSSFYNNAITPCSRCSCDCHQQLVAQCVRDGESPPLLQLPINQEPKPLVQCTKHMCPIRVHWHIQQSYREYWQVKITVTNLNFAKNYSQWNLEVLHPNLQNVARVYSFNYKPLYQRGHINDTGMFYGIPLHNDMLLQSGENGHVQSEILLNKDHGQLTFSNGWGFPRKISFNGEECVMPPPDQFPRLPNTAYLNKISVLVLFQFFFSLTPLF